MLKKGTNLLRYCLRRMLRVFDIYVNPILAIETTSACHTKYDGDINQILGFMAKNTLVRAQSVYRSLKLCNFCSTSGI